MDDPVLNVILADRRPAATIVDCPVHDGNLAPARTLGAAHSLEHGADLLVFLDVDCVPDEWLLDRYAPVARDSTHRASLLRGAVAYLPPSAVYRLTDLRHSPGSTPAVPPSRPARPARTRTTSCAGPCPSP
ncbi:hypothetical protein [Streptomyces sp. NPDC005752]|uniref:glycosyltransferase family 2 protein n=1 Tax=Streptomyces sp. NPDC005752 TaxID=3157065 RepID=UPI0033F39330